MWLIQKNIWKEQKYNQLFNYLDRYNIPYKMVKVIPFTDKIDVAKMSPEGAMSII
jgi:hypothetical protein